MKQNILRDIPIQTDDLLEIRNYAEALADFIKSCDTPVTIGIQGDWGIGKTSLLNLIQHDLRPVRGQSKRFLPVKIETWQYAQFNQEEYLSLSVINAINNGIIDQIEDPKQQQQLKEKTRKFFKTIMGVAANVGNQALRNYTGIDGKEAVEDYIQQEVQKEIEFEDTAREIERYKDHFVQLVRTVIPQDDGSKLVIMLDDLDRIKPIRALELLEAIKNFLDVERCVFILAVDYSVIEQGMEEKLGRSSKDFYGKSFFDKIIQVPFNMPVASYRTDRFIMSMLGLDYYEPDKKYYRNDIEDEAAFLAHASITSLVNSARSNKKSGVTQTDADYFANIAKITTNNNPRSIKRVINYANLLKIICRKNRAGKGKGSWNLQDAKIVFALASLQLTWQEIFNHFVQNPSPGILKRLEDMDYIAQKVPEAKRLFDRVRDPQETISKISGLFDQFLMLIDENGDGELSTDEFRPIWQIMIDTNLTNVKLENIDEQWKELEKRIALNLQNGHKKWTEEKVQLLLNGLKGKGSAWHNPLYFRLLSAGNFFKNIIWDQEPIGTIATTKGEVLQLYLNEKTLGLSDGIEAFIEHLPAAVRPFVSQYLKSHYGTGTIKVDLMGIADLGKQAAVSDILNQLLRSIRDQLDRLPGGHHSQNLLTHGLYQGE